MATPAPTWRARSMPWWPRWRRRRRARRDVRRDQSRLPDGRPRQQRRDPQPDPRAAWVDLEGRTRRTGTVAEALTAASTGAYQAVLKPIEGTILTVVRESAEAAQAASAEGASLVDVLRARAARQDSARQHARTAAGVEGCRSRRRRRCRISAVPRFGVVRGRRRAASGAGRRAGEAAHRAARSGRARARGWAGSMSVSCATR